MLGNFAAPGSAADPAKDIVGTWEGTSGNGGLKEIWMIERDKKSYSVKGIFKKGDDEVGSFVGKNPKFFNGVLTFVQEYSQKPNPTWTDGNIMQAKAVGNKLTFVWRSAGGSGTVILTRSADASDPKDDPKKEIVATKPKDPKETVPVNPKTPKETTKPKDPETIVAKPKEPMVDPKMRDPAPKVEKELALVGTWEADVEGVPDMKEVWKIENDNGKWSVKGVYISNKNSVGSFHGDRIMIFNGEMNFTQKYDVKPFPNWNDGNVFFVRPLGDKIEFNIGKKGFRKSLVKSNATLTEPKKKDDAPKVTEMSPEAKKEFAILARTWNFTEVMFDGMKIQFNAYWTFADGTVTEHLNADKTSVRRSGPASVDPDKSPKMIEIHFNKGGGGAPLGKFRGIYEISDGVLKLCLSGDGDPVPTEFGSKPGSKALLIYLKPLKK
jgi:uncharacterized protein (TIGR03067 family)